jgi:hypothetical protein
MDGSRGQEGERRVFATEMCGAAEEEVREEEEEEA